MKPIALLSLALLLSSCSWYRRNPSSAISEANMVTLEGSNALGVRDLLQKVDGLESQESPCDMGNCYEQGAVKVSCQHSAQKKASRQIHCSVHAARKTAPKLDLDHQTASAIATMVTRTSGGAKKFVCQQEQCQLEGELYISCMIPNGSTAITCALQDNTLL